MLGVASIENRHSNSGSDRGTVEACSEWSVDETLAVGIRPVWTELLSEVRAQMRSKEENNAADCDLLPSARVTKSNSAHPVPLPWYCTDRLRSTGTRLEGQGLMVSGLSLPRRLRETNNNEKALQSNSEFGKPLVAALRAGRLDTLSGKTGLPREHRPSSESIAWPVAEHLISRQEK